jgi:superfamily II DNA or RNA helicase
MSDLISKIPELIAKCEPRLRDEAERLVDADSVRGLDVTAEEVLAEVRLDDRSVNTRWALEDGSWVGETDVDDRVLHDLSLCTALIAIQRKARREPEAFKPAEIEISFQEVVEKRMARQFTPEEEAYFGKVEKRFQRVQQTGTIFDHDMVRLHPKWSIQSVDPLPLWPESPKTLREFWDYVALALTDRGLPIPGFLRNVADLTAVRDRLREWRQERTVPLWKERIRRLLKDDSGLGDQIRRAGDLRLLISPGEARLQGRFGDEEKFRPITGGELRELEEAQSMGGLMVPPEAELLLLSAIGQSSANATDVCRFDLDSYGQWIGSLFQQPALESRLVTLDEHAFRRASSLLRWQGVEDLEVNQLKLSLVTDTGEAAPSPLRVLHGKETQYLSEDTLFLGPLWMSDETKVEAAVSIPLAALNSQEGIEFMEKLGVPLPPSIAGRVKHEVLNVQVRAACQKKAPGSNIEYATFQAEALSQDGKVREKLSANGWAPVLDHSARDEDSIICRNREALASAEGIIRQLHPTWDIEAQGYRVRLTKTFPDQFNTWATQLPECVSLATDERLQTILADPLIARVRIEATQTSTIDWFDLRMIFEIEGADLKAAEIRKLVAAKGGFVQLADGTWRRVKLELTEEQIALMDQLGIDLDSPTDELHQLHWRQLTGDKAEQIINPRAWQTITQRMEQARLEEKPEPPEGLAVTLRPYQVDGYHFLAYLTVNKFGGILADDMGLGKTIQSISWVLWLRTRFRNAWPTLVICPKSVLDVWANEFTKAAPGLRVQIIRDKEELDLEKLKSETQVLVMNYAQMRGCIDHLETVKWLAIIMDEAQQIKNPDSQAARAARRLKAENRLALTGTPLENRLLDLWSLMTYAMPGALGDRAYFTRNFDRRKDGKASERLSARLRPFMLRRTKSQVARDLPSRSEESLLCEMSTEQAKLYKEELARAQHLLLTSSNFEVLTRKRFAVLQALTRLRQICCHPQLANAENSKAESAKLTATLELIEELHAEGHKVLLFSQFVSMLEILRERLTEMSIPYYWLTGSTNNRSEVVDLFQNDSDACVFLLSLKAGGSGLNLTAASYVILYDPWWNPAVEAQAIDRAHRIGQTQPVMAYRMITKNTIEEKIMLLQQKKQLMSANILGEGGFARTLEKNDFEFLFGLEAEEKMRQED